MLLPIYLLYPAHSLLSLVYFIDTKNNLTTFKMKFTAASAGAMLAGFAAAHPTFSIEQRQLTNIDTTILQFALTLEHLENVFYKGALANFTAQDFADAGYGADYYNDLNYIAHDEEVHVQVLSAALQSAGVTPNAACSYSFPYTDVLSFITLSSVLEGVGTSAYLAGAPLITNKNYLTVAGSILVTEALHTSMQRGAVNEVPMANPFGTPLDPTSVYTLAAMFITSCPASNAALPFVPFPTLTLDASVCTCEEPDCSPPQLQRRDWNSSSAPSMTASSSAAAPTTTSLTDTCSPPYAGSSVMLTAAGAIPPGSFVTFVSGLNVVSVAGTADGNSTSAAIPAVAQGQTYVFVTSSDQEGTLSDAAVLFGPAILEVYPPPPTLNYGIL